MLFGQSGFLYLLILIPCLVVFYLFVGRGQRRAIERLGNPELIAALSERVSQSKRRWKAILMLLTIAFVVIALARPQIGSRLELVEQQGVEVVVALDTSLSMMAQDVAPNRLERAKLAFVELMDRLPGARVGLVAFAGTSFVQFPLTTDFEAARLFLDAADVNTVSLPGTAIGDAIRTATRAFSEKELKYKVLILFTDGEDHNTDPIGAAKEAAEQGVVIHAIGFGSQEGEPIPVRDETGAVTDFKKDREGEVVLSKLDEATLREIAKTTGGEYYRATASGKEIDQIVAAIEAMDKKELESKLMVRHVERFQIPAALALLALVGEFVLTDRKDESREVRHAEDSTGCVSIEPHHRSGCLRQHRRQQQPPGQQALQSRPIRRGPERLSKGSGGATRPG
jgi:Ca-activated chloride channel family protein